MGSSLTFWLNSNSEPQLLVVDGVVFLFVLVVVVVVGGGGGVFFFCIHYFTLLHPAINIEEGL